MQVHTHTHTHPEIPSPSRPRRPVDPTDPPPPPTRVSGVVQLFETFKNQTHYYLVLEDLAGGDLFDRIEQNGPFKEEDAGPLLRQVVSAVQSLHERGIVHRDIKPDNLVFASR